MAKALRRPSGRTLLVWAGRVVLVAVILALGVTIAAEATGYDHAAGPRGAGTPAPSASSPAARTSAHQLTHKRATRAPVPPAVGGGAPSTPPAIAQPSTPASSRHTSRATSPAPAPSRPTSKPSRSHTSAPPRTPPPTTPRPSPSPSTSCLVPNPLQPGHCIIPGG